MDSLARSWRSSPWLQHLQGSLEHAPAASACSADCCALPAARRSRAVDIVDIFLQRIDGNRKRLEEASGSARASTGCNHRPSGTSGGPCGPAGAIGGVCACVPGVGPGGSFTTLRMSMCLHYIMRVVEKSHTYIMYSPVAISDARRLAATPYRLFGARRPLARVCHPPGSPPQRWSIHTGAVSRQCSSAGFSHAVKTPSCPIACQSVRLTTCDAASVCRSTP